MPRPLTGGGGTNTKDPRPSRPCVKSMSAAGGRCNPGKQTNQKTTISEGLDVACGDPDKEEDEGYLAAESGRALSANPYPPGTLRHDHWRCGWRIKRAEEQFDREHAGVLAEVARDLGDNPHPPGTIRFEEWRQGRRITRDRARRAERLRAQSA